MSFVDGPDNVGSLRRLGLTVGKAAPGTLVQELLDRVRDLERRAAVIEGLPALAITTDAGEPLILGPATSYLTADPAPTIPVDALLVEAGSAFVTESGAYITV